MGEALPSVNSPCYKNPPCFRHSRLGQGGILSPNSTDPCPRRVGGIRRPDAAAAGPVDRDELHRVRAHISTAGGGTQTGMHVVGLPARWKCFVALRK